MLFSCDLAELPGNPSDLTPDLHGLPAVEGTGHVLQRCARCDGGDAAIAGAVARADIHLPARGLDQHPDGGLPGDGLFLLRFRLRFRHSLLPGIVLRHSGHQGGMGLIAVLAVLLDSGLLLESLHGGFRFASELAVHVKGSTQLVQQFLQGFDMGFV